MFMSDEMIRVTKRDMTEELLVCRDLEGNIWFRFGFPMNEDGQIDRQVMNNLESIFLIHEWLSSCSHCKGC